MSIQYTLFGFSASIMKSTPIRALFNMISTSETKERTKSRVRTSVWLDASLIISLLCVASCVSDDEKEDGHFFRRSMVYLWMGFYL